MFSISDSSYLSTHVAIGNKYSKDNIMLLNNLMIKLIIFHYEKMMIPVGVGRGENHNNTSEFQLLILKTTYFYQI